VNASIERPVLPANTPDFDLLRRFEPVLRFTRGEQFYPMDVDTYVKESSLWAHSPDGRDSLIVRQGNLSLDELVESRSAVFGTVHYLRFIEPLSLSEAAQALTNQVRLRNKLKNAFHAGLGRLARGGLRRQLHLLRTRSSSEWLGRFAILVLLLLQQLALRFQWRQRP
jgi:hypothetical protein